MVPPEEPGTLRTGTLRPHGGDADQQRTGQPAFTHVAIEEVAAHCGLIIFQRLTDQEKAVCHFFGIGFRHGLPQGGFDAAGNVCGASGLGSKGRLDDFRVDPAPAHLKFGGFNVDDQVFKTVSLCDLFKN